MQDHLKEIVEMSKKSQAAIESIAKQREDVSVCTIKDAMTLVTECGGVISTNEHFIASEIFVKMEQREMFATIPDASARLDWLQRKYDAIMPSTLLSFMLHLVIYLACKTLSSLLKFIY
ncbi:hypothetical protein ZWY2020_048085 [Hordeum vulgare]|nr:hypothetical protein ZWY2020_048085 [Hordeum vulgare]